MAEQYDLRRLERDLAREIVRTPREVRRAVAAQAPVVRDSWRSRMIARRSSPTSIPHLPKTITHSMRGSSLEPEAEIGPDKQRKQGPLGNLLEFRPDNHRDGYAAIRAAEVPFGERIEKIARGFL